MNRGAVPKGITISASLAACGLAALALRAALLTNSATCENAGVSVTPDGKIVVAVDNGFKSPNSTVLDLVHQWPDAGDMMTSGSPQSYALSHDGALYLLRNTYDFPNRIYRVDLAGGNATLVGDLGPGREPRIAADKQFVYVVEQSKPAIYRAALTASQVVPGRFISGQRTGLQSPLGIAVNRSGAVCALESEIYRVLCFGRGASGDVAPTVEINLSVAGFGQVDALTIDRRGEYVVSGVISGAAAIAVYPEGSNRSLRPARVIVGPQTRLSEPYSLATDVAGDIVTIDQESGDISAFSQSATGNAAPIWTMRGSEIAVTHPYRIAVDPEDDGIAIHGSDRIAFYNGTFIRTQRATTATYYGDGGGDVAISSTHILVSAQSDGGIYGYSLTSSRTEPLFHIGLGASNFDNPQFVTLDPSGGAHFASTGGVVTSLSSDGSTNQRYATRQFHTAFGRDIDAMAADSKGFLYFATPDRNTIEVVSPIGAESLLHGRSTGLRQPSGLAVDGSGLLYVANTGASSITIYNRGAAGDTPPIRVLSGSATQLESPMALALDESGRLYVFDGPIKAAPSADHYVRVFSAGANGNAAPIRSYSVQTKCYLNVP